MLNDTTTPIPCERSRLDRIRDELLPGGAFEDEVAAALNCSRRYVQKLGLPYRKSGDVRIYDIAGAREVIQRLLRPPVGT